MPDPMKKTWLDNLPGDVRERLGNCMSRKSDIVPLCRARWAYLKTRPEKWEPEDALVSVLELLDCNGQYFDPTREEYDDILAQIY